MKEDYEKYETLYGKGWDKIHAERIARQEQLELFDYKVDAPKRPDHVPAWEELSEPQRDFEIRRGAAYAALVDRLDIEIGRFVEDIEQAGELDNTIILFLSDNEACPYERESRERVNSMVKQWTEMGANTAQLIPRMLKPVLEKASTPRGHWEWSDYHSDPSTTISEASAKRENPTRRK